MRKPATLLFTCLSVFAVLSVGFFWNRTGAEAARYGNDFGFGKRIAGTWVHDEFMVDFGDGNPIPFPTFRLIQTMNADGTYVHSSTSQAEFDEVEPRHVTQFEGTAHGSWRRTGPRRIETIQLATEDGPDGTLNYTRVRVFARLSRDFNSIEASAITDILDPEDDPLDPDATVMLRLISTFRGRKLQFD